MYAILIAIISGAMMFLWLALDGVAPMSKGVFSAGAFILISCLIYAAVLAW